MKINQEDLATKVATDYLAFVQTSTARGWVAIAIEADAERLVLEMTPVALGKRTVKTIAEMAIKKVKQAQWAEQYLKQANQ